MQGDWHTEPSICSSSEPHSSQQGAQTGEAGQGRARMEVPAGKAVFSSSRAEESSPKMPCHVDIAVDSVAEAKMLGSDVTRHGFTCPGPLSPSCTGIVFLPHAADDLAARPMSWVTPFPQELGLPFLRTRGPRSFRSTLPPPSGQRVTRSGLPEQCPCGVCVAKPGILTAVLSERFYPLQTR